MKFATAGQGLTPTGDTRKTFVLSVLIFSKVFQVICISVYNNFKYIAKQFISIHEV